MDLEAITFDFWNTLAVDSQPARVRELAAEKMTTGIRELGLKISREDMFKAFSECRQICYSYQEDKEIDFTPKEQLDWILEHFGVNTTLPMWNRLFLYYTTSLFDIPPFFAEGLEGILKELKAKYRLAVICNTGRTPGWVIRKILKDNDLEQHFDVLVFSNEMGIAKPNPLIFEITSRLLETHPSRIIHVGDDLRTDVGGALRAGFKTGWYNPKGIKKEVDCDFLLNNLSDLVKIQ